MLQLANQQDGALQNTTEARFDPLDDMTDGMSPNHILSIADLLDSYPDLDAILGVDNDSWLWETEDAEAQHSSTA